MENRYYKHQVGQPTSEEHLPFSLQVYKLYMEIFLKGYVDINCFNPNSENEHYILLYCMS